MARVRVPARPLNLTSFFIILSPLLTASLSEEEDAISLDKLALSPSSVGNGEKYVKWAKSS